MNYCPTEAAPPEWNFACPDWVTRLKERRSLVPDLPLDEKEATRAIRIFNKLRLPDVVDQPTMGEAAGDWFRDIVGAVFGSIDETGARRVPEVFGLVPKKNSKTTGGAGIMVTALLLNKIPRAKFLLVGPTQAIADLAFQQAAGMIEADEVLKDRFKVQEHLKTIKDLTNNATLAIKTFDMKVMTGAPPAGVLLDELHIMSSMSDAARVITQIRGGMITQPKSFLIIITTQSDEPPSGVFKEELKFARGVRDGRIKGEHVRMLPILYEFPEAMQTDKNKPWTDPQYWPMVTPNLDLSITLPRLISEFETAKEKGEEEIRRWASQHLNVEIGLALHSDRWRGADYWESAGDHTLSDLDEFIDRCEVIVAGIDGGGLDDLFGLCLAGRDKITKEWLYWFRGWAQPDVLERRKEIAQKLRDFESDGDLVICETATQDIDEAVAIIQRVNEAGLLPAEAAIGIDPQGVAALIDALAGAGLTDAQISGVAQGYRLSSAVWGMERKLKDGNLWHSGSPMMAWVISNARTEQRGNAVIITKQTSGKAKIDPLCAGFNATKMLERNPEAGGKSVYEERGILTV